MAGPQNYPEFEKKADESNQEWLDRLIRLPTVGMGMPGQEAIATAIRAAIRAIKQEGKPQPGPPRKSDHFGPQPPPDRDYT